MCCHGLQVKRCARCHVLGYCGKGCQQADWDLGHKHECRFLPAATEAYYKAADASSGGGGGGGGGGAAVLDGSLTDLLLAARTLWRLHRLPEGADAAKEVAALAVCSDDSGGGGMGLAGFAVRDEATQKLLPPGATAEQVEEVLARFQVNNFGVLDDLQVRSPEGQSARGKVCLLLVSREQGRPGAHRHDHHHHCIACFSYKFAELSGGGRVPPRRPPESLVRPQLRPGLRRHGPGISQTTTPLTLKPAKHSHTVK